MKTTNTKFETSRVKNIIFFTKICIFPANRLICGDVRLLKFLRCTTKSGIEKYLYFCKENFLFTVITSETLKSCVFNTVGLIQQNLISI